MNTKNIFPSIIVKVLFFALIIIGCISCGDKATLSEGTAISSVENYLKTHPVFETTEMEIGEIKFRLKKDEDKLKSYKELTSKGYINLELAKQKKRFLSKDSLYIYNVKLTDKSKTFVLTQKKEKVEVKSFEYQLDEKEKAKIELTGKKTGRVVVTLKKIPTDFFLLAKDKHPNSSFITKTFKLRYKKDEGWVVVSDK